MKNFTRLLIFCCLAIVFIDESYAFVLRSSDKPVNSSVPHAFVTLGASGDLAKRKIYPSLWYLYRDNLLPQNTNFYGYALSKLTVADLRERVKPFAKVAPGEEKLYEKFWSLNTYIGGSGEADSDYDHINEILKKSENDGKGNRIFYMALPPSVFPSAASQVKRACMAKNGETRVVIEKPFGHDLSSSQELSNHLSKLFTEREIYRIDHYLGKEMVQNILTLRFGNRLFTPSWNKDNIAAVEVLFEENLGVEGRGGYFDKYGIIRDVMQNHLLQVVSLVAMDKPVSGHPDDVRDAKVNLLKDTKSISLDDVVIGQYIGNPDSDKDHEKLGYLEDPTVPKDSLTPTFATTVLRINNQQWQGVPFIIRAGKGLGGKRTEVRIQYRDVNDNILEGEIQRNELVFRISGEAIEMNLMSKTPGITSDIEPIELDYVYKHEYKNLIIPDAYERLLLDIFRGSQMNFVRTDELREAWRIFTPVLHEMENKKVRPLNYEFGSRGPIEADELEKKNNYYYCKLNA